MNQSQLNNYWSEISQKLSSSITTVAYTIYISNAVPYTVNGDTLILSVPLASHKTALMTTYRDRLLNVIKDGLYPFNDFLAITSDEESKYQILEQEEKTQQTDLDESIPFIKEYTFDTYVIGDSNRLAAAACKSIAENPGDQFNPLFLYSHAGLGKTHLLNAIGNYLTVNSPKKKVIYITAENFMNDYIYSIRNNKNADYIRNFNERYRNADVLMIDDVQTMEKAEKSQEALFFVFNDLYAKKKQIIITSDRPLRNFSYFDERLTSRFGSGFTVDISYPSLEDRLAILQKKNYDNRFNVSEEVLYFLATTERQNIRVLQGMLNTIGLYGKLTDKRIDNVDLAKEALRDSIMPTEERITIESITEAAATYFNVKTSDLLSERRTKNVVEPRQYAMYIITELLPDIPLATIGQYFSRDHSTVINARDKIGRKKNEDEKVKTTIEDIKNMIYNK